jgi:hypothetical protein
MTTAKHTSSGVYRSIKLAQLNDEFDDVVPGTEREIIPEDAGMGEGCHLYKIRGKLVRG